MAYTWDEQYDDKGERREKVRKPHNTAFLNDDASANKFFKRKKKKVVKKSKPL